MSAIAGAAADPIHPDRGAHADERDDGSAVVAAGAAREGSLRRMDAAIVATTVALSVALVAGLLASIEVRVVAPGLDLVFDTVTTLVTLAVAVLAWQRYRDRGQRVALFSASAFLVLSVGNAIATVEALAAIDAAGLGGHPALGVGALYASTAARLAAAALLVVGEASVLRSAGSRHPRAVVAGPALAVVALVVAAPALVVLLPPLVVPGPPGSSAVPGLPVPTQANVVLQALGALLFAVAAILARRRAVRGGPVSQRYVAVALVFATFAQVHLALYPSAYAGILTGGDLLFLAFDLILLLGVEADTRAYVVDLRRANLGLERLRDAEVERAAMEERARLSRELHDGLAQDLWFAKLKVGRLAAIDGLGPDAVMLVSELDEAIDAGLTEARQAVMALRTVDAGGGTFVELMRRYVDDYGDRFGIRTEFDAADGIPPLGTRPQAELLRIAQEALSNIRRHADATVVRVEVSARPGWVTMSIRDNGRGFDPAAVEDGGFGITSMAERAALVGGRLAIDSRPQGGTRVTADVPVAPDGARPVSPDGRALRQEAP